MGRPRKNPVPQEPLATEPSAPAVQLVSAPAVEPLDDYIARHEALSQAQGLVVTRVSYPGAKARIFPGTYAGIPIEDGPLSARYSDGSTH